MTATDLTGAETIMAPVPVDEVVKAGKGQVVANSQLLAAAERLADALQARKEFTELIVRYRAPGGNQANNTGPGAQAAIRALDPCRYDHLSY